MKTHAGIQSGGRKRLRLLAEELGIDVQACVETAYDVAKCVAESEQLVRYVEVAKLEPNEREVRLMAENERLRAQSERLQAVNHHLWAILMEEHHFIEAGWLRRCVQAACLADDRELITRLGQIQDRLREYGGHRGYKRRGGRPKRKTGEA